MENQSNTEILSHDEIIKEIRPLSQNSFAAFFQKMWRKWLSVWYGFCDRKPKLSKFLYQIGFFMVFSMGVTIFQYLGFTFLPMLFGLPLAGHEFMWPKLPMYEIKGVTQYWSVLGYGVIFDKVTGAAVYGGGLGFFIAAEISMFLAQVINFPLQRNITFKSHGNPYWQAMWYFIGWVLTSLFVNGVNNLWLPLGAEYLPPALYNILYTFSMGFIAMIIFFFIFRIIFPDRAAAEKRARGKLAKLQARGADAEKRNAAAQAVAEAEAKAVLAEAEKQKSIAITQASAKSLKYLSAFNELKKNESSLSAQKLKERVALSQRQASESIAEKNKIVNAVSLS